MPAVTQDAPFRYQAVQGVTEDSYFRYAATMALFQDSPFRYAAQQGVTQSWAFRYSNTTVEVSRAFRYASLDDVSQDTQFRYTANGPGVTFFMTDGSGSGDGTDGGTSNILDPFTGLPVTFTETFDDSWQCGCSFSYNFSASLQTSRSDHNGGTLTPATQFTITFKESAPTTWTLSMIDEIGTFVPDYNNGVPTGGAIGPSLDGNSVTVSEEVVSGQTAINAIVLAGLNMPTPSPLDTKFINITGGSLQFDTMYLTLGESYNTRLNITASTARTEFTFSGIPTHYSWSFGKDNTFKIQIMGSDDSYILFRNDENLGTVRSTAQVQINARAVVQELLNDMGIAADVSRMNDYIIPVFHRQNAKRMEWVKKLLEVVVAEWQVVNGVFTVYEPNPGAAPSFVYDHATVCIEEVRNDQGNATIVNNLVASDAKELGLNGKSMTVTNWGQYTITFDVPLSSLSFHPIVTNFGEFSDLHYYDAGGNLVAVSNVKGDNAYPLQVLNGGRNNIKKVVFTWGQPTGFASSVAFSPYGVISFFGVPYNSNGVNGGYNGSPTDPGVVNVSDQTSIESHGWFKKELPPNPLIPNLTVLENFAIAWLKRYGRQSRRFSMKVPLNVLVKPGIVIKYVNAKALINLNLYVTEVTHSFSDDANNRFSTITCVEYQQ